MRTRPVLFSGKPGKAFLLLSLPTALVAVAASVLLAWRVPTRVEVDMTLDRARFTVHDPSSARSMVLKTIDFDSLSIRRFARITLKPKKIELADPAQYDFTADRFPDTAWKVISPALSDLTITARNEAGDQEATIEHVQGDAGQRTTPAPVRLDQGSLLSFSVAGDQGPALTIALTGSSPNTLLTLHPKSADPKPLGSLDPLVAPQGADITLHWPGDRRNVITIEQTNKQQREPIAIAAFLQRGSFQLITTNAVVAGDDASRRAVSGSQTYRVHLGPDSPHIRFSSDEALVLQMTVASEVKRSIFSDVPIPVRALEFTHPDELGNPRSTVVGDGEIRYPDFPDMKAVSFKSGDLVQLEGLEHFTIKEISLAPAKQGLRFRLDGFAKHAYVSSGALKRDHSMTGLEVLLHNRSAVMLAAVVVWVFTTTVGAYRLYKELRTRTK